MLRALFGSIRTLWARFMVYHKQIIQPIKRFKIIRVSHFFFFFSFFIQNHQVNSEKLMLAQNRVELFFFLALNRSKIIYFIFPATTNCEFNGNYTNDLETSTHTYANKWFLSKEKVMDYFGKEMNKADWIGNFFTIHHILWALNGFNDNIWKLNNKWTKHWRNN